VSQLFAWQFKEKRILFEVIIDDKLPLCYYGDPTRINQILINLIGNALKFTAHGLVKLSLSKNETNNKGNVLLTVADTGIGISKEISESIFLPFQQGENSASKNFGGTGLGLAITKKLVQLMDGEIWVSSEVGKGSCFSISLPMEESKVLIKNQSDSPLPVDHNLIKLKDMPLKILLVDDAINNRNLILAYLKAFPFVITQAENGLKALEILKKETFDLVLMDIQMPEMDGYTATNCYRTWETKNRSVRLPIIALTAYALKEERDKCFAAGCDEHLSKPIKKDKLLESICRICK
jgi:CheY-like chemotaxis protein